MTPAEKEAIWRKTVAAFRRRNPQAYLALLVALILRHGRLKTCGDHAHVTERVSIEELYHAAETYYLNTKVAEHGIIEVEVVAKADVDPEDKPL